MRFITILIGSLILSTAVMAVEAKGQPSSAPKAAQEMSPGEKLKLMNEKIRPHNAIFDNHHTGGIPYEPNK